MEPSFENKEKLDTIEDAVEELLRREDEVNVNNVIEYLKSHPGDITEFCLQVYDAYAKKSPQEARKVDKTGVMDLALLIERLLEK